jgi:hypothetical protein
MFTHPIFFMQDGPISRDALLQIVGNKPIDFQQKYIGVWDVDVGGAREGAQVSPFTISLADAVK